ncbi:Reverse transcriptase domain-containing protein, partial [Aphis craccivora]
GIRNSESDFGNRNSVFGIRSSEFRSRNSEFGIRGQNSEYSFRNSEFGIRLRKSEFGIRVCNSEVSIRNSESEFGNRNSVFGIRNSEFSIWNSESEIGIQNLVFGIRNSELGSRNSEFGIRVRNSEVSYRNSEFEIRVRTSELNIRNSEIGIRGQNTEFNIRNSEFGIKGQRGWGNAVAMTIYKCVFIPRMAYAASTWAQACMGHYRHRNRANTAQRRPLLAITGAYKTTSTAALQILAGLPPLDLELGRVARIERGKAAVRRGETRANEAADKEVRYNIAAEHLWERRWVAGDKGRRTASWFPTVRSRLERVWVIPDHYTSQFMTGHGDFAASLCRFGLKSEARCKCGCPEETSEHVLYWCPLFSREREKLVAKVLAAGADWPCSDEFMTSSEDMFLAFKNFAHRALDAKMKALRSRATLKEANWRTSLKAYKPSPRIADKRGDQFSPGNETGACLPADSGLRAIDRHKTRSPGAGSGNLSRKPLPHNKGNFAATGREGTLAGLGSCEGPGIGSLEPHATGVREASPCARQPIQA